jgi:serpin B
MARRRAGTGGGARDVEAAMSWRALLVAMAGLATACGGGDGGVETAAPDADVTRAEPSADVSRAAVDAAAPVAELAAGLNGAGFALWRTLPAEDNVVFSPSSIGHALLMARAAADDPTAAAIDATLGLPDGDAAHAAWNAIDQALDEPTHEEVTLAVADRIWPRTGLEPDQDWVDLLASYHGVDVESLDFAGDASGSRDTINNWVSEQTRELIPELLPDGFIDDDTALVLTDALYFEAQWRTVFGKYGTEPADFTRLDGSTVPVDLMVEKEIADRRGRGDGFVGAELPYAGDAYSMLVLVPDEGRFAEVRDRLDQALLDEVDAAFTTGHYGLYLPSWEDEEQVDLMPWLETIGAAPGAYPAISPDTFLGGAVHGANIAVDEWGTVAAAATALGFNESAAQEPEITVRADHPFLYVIRHRDTGLVLFAGQVTDPAAG